MNCRKQVTPAGGLVFQGDAGAIGMQFNEQVVLPMLKAICEGGEGPLGGAILITTVAVYLLACMDELAGEEGRAALLTALTEQSAGMRSQPVASAH
jgi:hypothetical protein